jgi:hypothetical protein
MKGLEEGRKRTRETDTNKGNKKLTSLFFYVSSISDDLGLKILM